MRGCHVDAPLPVDAAAAPTTAAPTTVDTAPPPPPPVDAAPPPDPNVTVFTACEAFPCQALFLAATACNGDGEVCTSQAFVQGETVRTNYCHANGVKKQSSNLSTDQGYSTSMRVSRPGRRALLHARDARNGGK